VACLGDATIVELVEGRLGTEAAARAHDHLATCDACRALAADALRVAVVVAPDAGSPGAATAPLASTSVSGVVVSELPPAPPEIDGDRFVLGELLGSGGMGRVYRAEDRQLGRAVALKLVRDPFPGAAARILREARAQARVDHPNVCKVFEVSGEGHQPYIAMQLIEGQPLDRAAARLDLAGKVRLFVQVVHGVVAAHRQGLIHRDLKPSNVLVAEDGHAYVTDFGLAIDVGARVTAASGTVVGTPQFMSPEQARGARALDERSDVYGLGATLHFLLAGAPPFDGPMVEVLRKIVAEDPPRLRGVPRDLAIIVAKCLEKDAARRYASALALADDLERFLSGEPIRARPPTAIYRAVKFLRRHRALALSLLVAAVALGASSVVAFNEHRAAAARATASLRFGREIEAMADIMDRAHALPLHDLGRERGLVRARMRRITDEMAELGAAAAGPGEAALGRGFEELEDWEAARQHLGEAWRRGERGPDVAYALGLAFGRLYEQGLVATDQLADAAARTTRRQELAAELRDPALAYLAAAGGADVESPELVAARIAEYDGRADEAIARAEQAFAVRPWLHEAEEVIGRAHVARARAAADDARYADAQAELDAAADAYRTALDLARSDPALLDAECERGATAMALPRARNAHATAPQIDAAYEACRRALVATPGHVTALIEEAVIHRAVATALSDRGSDPGPEIELALAPLTRALALAPARADVWHLRGDLYLERGQLSFRSGGHGAADLDRAMLDLRVARTLAPRDAAVAQALGAASLARAREALYYGIGNPVPALDAAIASLTPIASDPRVEVAANALQTLGVVYLKRAQYERGSAGAWRPWIVRAIAAGERSCALACTERRASNTAYAYSTRAELEADTGDDPTLALAGAEVAFARALALGGRNLFSTRLSYAYYLLKVGWIVERAGRDPGPTLDRAIAAFEEVSAQGSIKIDVLNGLASALYLRARAALERGADPTPLLARADHVVGDFTRLYPNERNGHIDRGQILILRARWDLAHGRDPAADFAAADQALARAAALHGGPDDLDTTRAELHLWRATWRPSAADVAAGIAAADAALAADPHDRRAAAALAALRARRDGR
jgi:serine/threonine-protein kinase